MKILLHICCGICAASVGERLLAEGYEVTGFFFNPNIHPQDEYIRRLQTTEIVSGWLKIPLVVPEYQPNKWHKSTLALKQEPEGGKRCEICYQIRLQKTYDYLVSHDFTSFTTTLTVSPHKSSPMINRIGKEIGSDRFLIRDFKKKDGFKRSNQIAAFLGIYHQDYCGCIYSRRK